MCTRGTRTYKYSKDKTDCSYLFLRMKLLLENLKLCWGTHDMLLPMLLSSMGVCAPLRKNCCSLCNE